MNFDPPFLLCGFVPSCEINAPCGSRSNVGFVSHEGMIVDLMDGRTICEPLGWYPRLLHATPEARAHWETCGGGYGIHWPELDEDLSVEGLLRGAPAAGVT